MARRRRKFRWSDEDIVRALGFHAISDPHDEEIIRDLAELGASQILARRGGGRTQKPSSARGELRRILILIIFEGEGGFAGSLSPRLRKTPTAPPTVRKVHQILLQCGWKVSEATVLNDIKKLGSRKLRET
jgi:arginine repressor